MFSCQHCSVALNSQEQLNQHQAGKSHAKKLTRLGIALPVTQPQGQNENYVPKYGGAFVAPQGTQVQDVTDEEKKTIQNALTTAKTLEDFNSIMAKEFDLSIPPPPPPPPPVIKAENKVAKRKFTEIYCEVCHVTINSDVQAWQHFQGQKHSKKIKLIEDVTEGEATSSTDDGGHKKITTHFCHFCNIGVNSQEQLQFHRNGSKHRKTVEKLQSKPAPVQPSSAEKSTDTIPDFSSPVSLPPFETYVSTS